MVCYVSFRPPGRVGEYAHVTTGSSLFDAVRKAMNWFLDDHWCGPRPGPDTIMHVSLVGEERKWQVRAGRIVAWSAAAEKCVER